MIAHWQPAEDWLDTAGQALLRGELVGMPTETVYGLAGDALNPQAVAAIFAAKDRPLFDPLIVHAPERELALALAREIPDAARELARTFWPGPLTLVLARDPRIPDLVTAGLDTVALRVPDHPVAQALMRRCGLALAAPSANRFGRVSPTRADHVLEEMAGRDRVAGVLDAGPCSLGVESTVVAFPGGRPRILRLGGLPVEAIEARLGPVEVVRAQHAVDDPQAARRGEQSPGMLARHYAPRTPLTLLQPDDPPPSPWPAGAAWLRFNTPIGGAAPGEVLSPAGDLDQAAANLFGALRRLDASGADLILAWPAPDHGLGRAINDRLTRAAHSD